MKRCLMISENIPLIHPFGLAVGRYFCHFFFANWYFRLLKWKSSRIIASGRRMKIGEGEENRVIAVLSVSKRLSFVGILNSC